MLIFSDGLNHIVDEAVTGAVMFEGKVVIIGAGDAHTKAATGGTNPYPVLCVLVDALNFVTAQFSVVVIIGQVVLRVSLQGIGGEDVDSVTISYPYPTVRIFDDGARAALSESFGEKVAEGISVVLFDGKVQSAAEGAYPHATFAVTVEGKDMVITNGMGIVGVVDIPFSANAETFATATHPLGAVKVFGYGIDVGVVMNFFFLCVDQRVVGIDTTTTGTNTDVIVLEAGNHADGIGAVGQRDGFRVNAFDAFVQDSKTGNTGVFRTDPDSTGTVFHDVLQIVGADVTEAVNLEVEVLELFCDSVVGEEPVAVGGDPDNAPGVVYNVVAFHVHIVQFIGRGETEGFNSMGGGVDIPYLTGVIVDPEVPPIIRQHIAVTDVEIRMSADALSFHVE